MSVRDRSFAQIQAEVREADRSGLARMPVTVLRNVMVEPIEPYLVWLGLEDGFSVELRLGGFDTMVQESMGDSGGLLDADTRAVLVFNVLEGASWELARGFATLAPGDIEAERTRLRELATMVVRGIRRQSGAMILWHAYETPLYPAYGVVDGSRPGGQAAAVRALNDDLGEVLAGVANAFLIDLDLLRARVGAEAFYDRRYWHIGRAPYSRTGLREIAEEDATFLRALAGRTRKCLVLDCDNLLWGGIVGEDGLDGIRLGPTHPGSAFRELQQEVVGLGSRGVILALCSKNNEADVWEVFDRHPEMVLKREHLAAWRINWQDKATNLRELAHELNIGLEHLVFVDDSDFEVGLVRDLVPEVTVLHLPTDDAVHHRDRLAGCRLFDALSFSETDRQRNAMYRAETERRQLREGSGDIADYLRSLGMIVEVRRADSFSVPRVAQLTQKTNQFNLTTRRYTDEDILRASEAEDADVLTLRLSDRFGDSGLVGAALLFHESGEARIDTFLLSCRVLGRHVEDVFLQQCVAAAAARGAERILGSFRKTARNGMVEDFYSARGFERIEGSEAGADFELLIAGWDPGIPDVFARIETDWPQPTGARAGTVGAEAGEETA